MLTKTVTLEPKDVESIERVLSALSGGQAQTAKAGSTHSATQLVEFGRLMFALRQQRYDFCHPAMLGEPAFDILLSLYTAADEQSGINLARLSELSRLSQSSGLRWIDYLSSKKLIERKPHPTDKRSSLVNLTAEGRAILDALLGTMLRQVIEFTSAV